MKLRIHHRQPSHHELILNWFGAQGEWYFPGNGGLLYAVAMKAAGWDGCPEGKASGFPDHGTWNVKWEGLQKAP